MGHWLLGIPFAVLGPFLIDPALSGFDLQEGYRFLGFLGKGNVLEMMGLYTGDAQGSTNAIEISPDFQLLFSRLEIGRTSA